MAKRSEINIVDFPPGELEPLFVRASDIGKVVIGLSPKTASNWRSQKIGPAFCMILGKAYYEYKVLKEFFSQNPVQTTGALERENDGGQT